MTAGHRITPHEDEFRRFFQLLRDEGVTSYLEIGARDGNTFAKVMRALPDGACGVAVDLPGARWGWDKSDAALRSVCAALRRSGKRATEVVGDSQAKTTVATVAALGPYDAVFIDADHDYQSVKRDWESYGSMARIVAFHDIAPPDTPRAGPIDVPRLWRELDDDPRVARKKEILGAKPGMGIGVVWRHPAKEMTHGG